MLVVVVKVTGDGEYATRGADRGLGGGFVGVLVRWGVHVFVVEVEVGFLERVQKPFLGEVGGEEKHIVGDEVGVVRND